MKKHGFVYLWYDRKHHRYYIGSHWGSEQDGYVCSSSWMKRAYRLRPHDFRRRILVKELSSPYDMFQEEQRWLDMIKPEEMRVRYYNLCKFAKNHWRTSNDVGSTVEKIAANTKAAMARPEVRQRYLDGLKKRKPLSTEAIAKRNKAIAESWERRSPKHLRKQRLKRDDPRLIEVYRHRSLEMWANRRG